MDKELLKLKNRHNRDLVFSPTHEEAITSLMAGMSQNLGLKNLPLRAYQVARTDEDQGPSRPNPNLYPSLSDP